MTGTVGCGVPVAVGFDTALLLWSSCLLHLGAARQPSHGVAAGVVSQRALEQALGQEPARARQAVSSSVMRSFSGLSFGLLAILSGS